MKNNIPQEEPKQEYEYIGECNGNNDNGCFLDSCGHDCGCFERVLKQPKQETHICKYCGAETTQPDDECYAKPKQETLEEAAENYGWRIKINTFSNPVKANDLANSAKQDFIEGAKWQQERMYSEDDLLSAFEAGMMFIGEDKGSFREWLRQFKKK
jgi:hypothetical protein